MRCVSHPDIEMDLLEKNLSLTVRYTCCLNLSVVNEGLYSFRAVIEIAPSNSKVEVDDSLTYRTL